MQKPEWIYEREYRPDPWSNDVLITDVSKCSRCAFTLTSIVNWNFCPDCGIRMEGVDDKRCRK